MKFFNLPKGVLTIAFGNLWDTFSYYGTQTILVLYLIHMFHFSNGSSYLIYGAYVSMSFSTPIFGGVIADRYLGGRNTLLVGGTLAIIGNLLLMVPSQLVFFFALATTLIGSGLYKCNATQMLGALYKHGTRDKEKGFTLLYLAINIGGTLAPLGYGLIIYKFNAWNYAFLISALGIGMSILLFLLNLESLPENIQPNLKKGFIAYTAIVSAILFLFVTFADSNFVVGAPILVFVLGITYLIRSILKTEITHRKPLFGLLLLSFFAMFYFAAGMQIGTTVTLFIQDAVKGFKLPASTFNMLYSGFVLILAPIFTFIWAYLRKKKIDISLPQKVVLGIILAALGMASFAVAAKSGVVISSILLGYILLSAGELVITPAVYTAISNNTAPNLKGAMMGGWFLFIGMGSYLSGVFSKIAMFTNSYFLQFSFFSAITFIAAFGLVFALSKLNVLIK